MLEMVIMDKDKQELLPIEIYRNNGNVIKRDQICLGVDFEGNRTNKEETGKR